jgi:predicted amidohydrolase YtcJ
MNPMERGSTIGIINGVVYPLAPPGRATALFARDGVLEFIGGDEEVIARCDHRTTLLDLRGAFVFPAFGDTHLHLIEYGRSLMSLDLRGASSISQMIGMGRKAVEGDPSKGWHIGWGWDQESLEERRFPTRRDLDLISDQRPIFYERACGHVGVLNTPGLRELGLMDNPRMAGPFVETDLDGVPNGVVSEEALMWVRSRLPVSSEDELRCWLKRACEALLAKGVTWVQSDDLSAFGSLKRMAEFYLEEDKEGRLPLRVDLIFRIGARSDLEELEEALRLFRAVKPRYCGIGPVKLVLDGTIGARTAALNEPYWDAASERGFLAFTQEELEFLMKAVEPLGCQVACHAIGDRALAQAVSAFETLRVGCSSGLPPRVLHCQVGDPELYSRMAQLGVTADIQPLFLANDWKIILDRLGPDRARNSYAWKTMVDRGVALSGESDAPYGISDPLEGIRIAVTRKDMHGEPEHGWMPNQRLDISEAFWLYTGGAAKVCGRWRNRGSLEVGKSADLIALLEDPFRVEPDRIGGVEVGLTVCGGKIRYLR